MHVSFSLISCACARVFVFLLFNARQALYLAINNRDEEIDACTIRTIYVIIKQCALTKPLALATIAYNANRRKQMTLPPQNLWWCFYKQTKCHYQSLPSVYFHCIRFITLSFQWFVSCLCLCFYVLIYLCTKWVSKSFTQNVFAWFV